MVWISLRRARRKYLFTISAAVPFDISILEISDGVFEVVATAGNNRLGGDDFDQRIMDYLVDTFKKEHGIDLSKDRMAMQRLKEAAEKAKIELSTLNNTKISLPFISMGESGPIHMDVDLSRAKFEALISDLVQQTVDLTKRALSDSGFSASQIDKVILVGGSTRVPCVVDAVRKVSGKEPFKGINPDECVAIGAAIQAESSAERSRTCCFSTLRRFRWVSKPWAEYLLSLLTEIRPFLLKSLRYSLRLRTISHLLIFTFFRASVLWLRIIKRLLASS